PEIFLNQSLSKPTIQNSATRSLPIPLLTAFEAILDHGRTRPGTRVLVTGASDAVGRTAVQLVARLVEGHVIALASLKTHDSLRQLGADKVVDYAPNDWESKIDGRFRYCG
ncbi:hypothetical protein LY76DRAFT_674314, partial [Colletotrichum caudatum]